MPDAAILNGTKRHPGTRYGKSYAMSPCDKSKFRDYVVLCPRVSFRDAIPMALRLPRRCAPRNDIESGRFCSKPMFCAICCIFCIVSLCIVFQTFRSENRSVFQQNLPILSLRGGHFQCPTRQSETQRDGIPERTTREGGKAAVGCITISRKNRRSDGTAVFWRCRPDLNWGVRVLQTLALPLGHGTEYEIRNALRSLFVLERVTRLELATSTLARWRSTR